MPFTFNGIGTTYYGMRDFRPDTSYVTTEWMVVVYLPLFPLRSVRLMTLPEGRTNLIVYSSQRYLTVEKLPLHWRQVLATYGYVALWILWMIGLGMGVDALGSRVSPLISTPAFIVLVLLPLFLPSRLRNAAQRHVAFSEEAVMETLQRMGLLTPPALSPPPLPGSTALPPRVPSPTHRSV